MWEIKVGQKTLKKVGYINFVDRCVACKIFKLAKKNNCLFYSAPDTYLAESVKATKELIKRDEIGKVLSVNIVSTCNPVETWHPNPHFFIKRVLGHYLIVEYIT